MKRMPLTKSNPHLRDPKKFREGLIMNVASSTAIETGQSVESIAKALRDAAVRRESRSKRAAPNLNGTPDRRPHAGRGSALHQH